VALRLNLGSGDVPIPGFVNLDGLSGAPGVDVVADLAEPLPYDDGSVDLIYAAHILEHFATDEVPARLGDWRRVLRPGGVLMVAVPDLDVIARTLVDRSGWFTPPNNPWLGLIYGGQKDEYDFHKTGFTAPWLIHLLHAAGFDAARRVDRFDVPVNDASQSPLPFGRNISLNVVAVAGEEPSSSALLATSRVERLFDPVDAALHWSMRFSTRARSKVMERRRRGLERTLDA
jgi:predicted SAM-dependent methyltransferase